VSDIDLLETEKELLYKELKIVQNPSQKEEIVNKILDIEQKLLKLCWEATIPSDDNSAMVYSVS